MGALILLFEIFFFFRLMQKIIEVKHYCLLERSFPAWKWVLFGRAMEGDGMERREAIIYKWLANLFLVYFIFGVLFFELDDSVFHGDELLRASVVMVLFALLRAMPHILAISKSIKNLD